MILVSLFGKASQHTLLNDPHMCSHRRHLWLPPYAAIDSYLNANGVVHRVYTKLPNLRTRMSYVVLNHIPLECALAR